MKLNDFARLRELAGILKEDSGTLTSWAFVKLHPDQKFLVDLKDLFNNFKKGMKLLGFKGEQKVITSEIKSVEITITTKSGSKYIVDMNDLLSSSEQQEIEKEK